MDETQSSNDSVVGFFREEGRVGRCDGLTCPTYLNHQNWHDLNQNHEHENGHHLG